MQKHNCSVAAIWGSHVSSRFMFVVKRTEKQTAWSLRIPPYYSQISYVILPNLFHCLNASAILNAGCYGSSCCSTHMYTQIHSPCSSTWQSRVWKHPFLMVLSESSSKCVSVAPVWLGFGKTLPHGSFAPLKRTSLTLPHSPFIQASPLIHP